MKYFSIAALAATLVTGSSYVYAQGNLNIAKFNSNGELQYPADLYKWIQTGASIGGDYGDKPFDPQHPGTLGVVQMEPAAYDYFMKNKQYADGTMFLLSFYRAESKSDPQLPGFVQGDLIQREIHVLDKQRFADKHAFFVYRGDVKSVAAMPAGNACVVCHNEHGKFESTFVQFYPDIRAKLGIK